MKLSYINLNYLKIITNSLTKYANVLQKKYYYKKYKIIFP